MNLIELNAIKRHIESQVEYINSIKVKCLDCNNFQAGVCVKFGSRPPDDWIHGSVTCEEWEWDSILF